MPFQAAMRQAMGMIAQVEALGALAAGLGEGERPVTPAIRAAMDPVLDLLGREAWDDLTPREKAMIRGFALTTLKQATDLVERPDRPAAWSFEDPVILDSIGRGSRVIADALSGFAAGEPALAERLDRPARFLDAGTGAGWIAIGAAERWPLLGVTALDLHEPALALARANVAAAGLDGRIEVREGDLLALDEAGAYAIASVPTPFFPPAILPEALARVHRALETGGWVAFLTMEASPEPMPQALLALRVVRYGGRPWTEAEARDLLAGAGFEPRFESVAVGPARLILGRKP